MDNMKIIVVGASHPGKVAMEAIQMRLKKTPLLIVAGVPNELPEEEWRSVNGEFELISTDSIPSSSKWTKIDEIQSKGRLNRDTRDNIGIFIEGRQIME